MEKNNLKLVKIIVYYRPIRVSGHMFILFQICLTLDVLYVN